MRKILALTMAASLIGCASMDYKYKADYSLAINEAKVNGQNQPIDKGMPLTFKNEDVKIYFEPMQKSVVFTIENLTDTSIKVHWDDSVLIVEGQPEKIFHTGVNFSDATRFMPASIIPGKSSLKDGVVPSSYIHFNAQRNASGWYADDLMPELLSRANDYDVKKLREYVAYFDNRDIYDLMLTLEINGQKREYYFDFYVSSAKMSEVQKLVPVKAE